MKKDIIDQEYLQAKKSFSPEQIIVLKELVKIGREIKKLEYKHRKILGNNIVGINGADLHKYERDLYFDKAKIFEEKKQSSGFRDRLLSILSGLKSLLPPKLPKN